MQSARPVAPRVIPNRRHTIAQGISDYVNSNVDVILITLMMSVTDVAVYAVYAAVITLCTRIIENVISSFGAAFGNMYAKGEKDAMRENIKIYELIVFSLCSTIFATALAMIVPFVDVYTDGITDADYHQPLFAFLLTLSALFMCFRIPYETVLKAAGHFKQTKPGAYVELSLNLVLSVVGVLIWGLPGVALGTLMSAIVRTFELAWYFGRHLIVRSYSAFIGHVIIALTICAIAFCLSAILHFDIDSWGNWILVAGSVFGITIALTGIVDWLVYRNETRSLMRKIFAGAPTDCVGLRGRHHLQPAPRLGPCRKSPCPAPPLRIKSIPGLGTFPPIFIPPNIERTPPSIKQLQSSPRMFAGDPKKGLRGVSAIRPSGNRGSFLPYSRRLLS